jgi:alpha-mannosidase
MRSLVSGRGSTAIGLILILTLRPAFLPAQTRMNPSLKDVVVVFKTHFDNGYTDLSETVLQRYASTLIEGALKGMDATASQPAGQQFVWTLAGYPTSEILRRNPGLRSRVGEAIKHGRLAVHALPLTFETESMTPELLVRGFRFSDDIARAYGLDLPTDAKLTDVPSHSWILPTVLVQAGITFLHIGCNAASQSPDVPLLFWWEGPDGSRLMTMYWGGYYGTDLVPPAGWPYTSWLAIIPTNDNSGAPPPEEINATLAKIRELAPNARIRVGRMSDFADAIAQEHPQLPVVRGDMPDTWIHGYFSMPKEFCAYSRSLKELKAVESVGATLDLLNGTPPLTNPVVDKAYEELLLFSEHTFGMAMSHGHSGTWRYDADFQRHRAMGEYDMIEHSWKEKGNHVFEARRITLPALANELGRLAAGVNAEGTRVVVYNPLPYARSAPVEIHAHSTWYGIRGLKDAATGQIIPLDNKDNVYRFRAIDVPAMGYRTYLPADSVTAPPGSVLLDSARGVIENEFLFVKLDTRTGRLTSVRDKSTGLEMIGNGPFPFGGYLYQKFTKTQVDAYAEAYIKGGWDWAGPELGRPGLDDRPGSIASGENPEITWSSSANKVTAFLQFSPTKDVPQRYTLAYSLGPGQRALEIVWGIDSKPAEPWPEAGWVSFPLNVSTPEFRVGRLGGIADPKKDFVKGSNFEYFMTDRGVALYGADGAGFAIASPDAPAISLDRPGLWTWTGRMHADKANVFFNLFNNQWSTNFTEWIEGSWSARFYIWAFQNYDPSAALVVPAEDVCTPMHAVIVSGPGGRQPLTFRGVEVRDKNVSVTAFAPDASSGGFLLRLWESAGRTCDTEIRLPDGSAFRSAMPVDLRGRKSGPAIPVVNGTLRVACPANRPVSLILSGTPAEKSPK